MPAWALVCFSLGIWWGFPNRPKRFFPQHPRLPQRLYQMRLVCLYQSVLSVLKLQILWVIKLFAGRRNPKPRVHSQRLDKRDTILPTCFLAFFRFNHSPILKYSIRSIEITFILTALEGLKTVQDSWLGKGYFSLKKLRKSESVLQSHAGLLPKSVIGYPSLHFSFPEYEMGLVVITLYFSNTISKPTEISWRFWIHVPAKIWPSII